VLQFESKKIIAKEAEGGNQELPPKPILEDNDDNTTNRNKEAQQSDDTHQTNAKSTRSSNQKHQSCLAYHLS
jgi:hypothetical protein